LTGLTGFFIGLILSERQGKVMEKDEERDAEEVLPLKPEFAEALRRSLAQAEAGETVELEAFRRQLGR
jgi:hypothetical protein